MRLHILILLALSVFSQSAWATADGADCFRVVGIAAHDTLNIRTAPNAKAKMVGKIPANATVKNVPDASDIECPDTIEDSPPECLRGRPWCKVQYKDVTGWARCKFLEADECL